MFEKYTEKEQNMGNFIAKIFRCKKDLNQFNCKKYTKLRTTFINS